MTFDLERARELVWAVSERKIWTLLERTGYGGDIDKRRERQAITEICDKQFPSAIAEIERLKSLIDKTAKNFLKLDPGVQWEGGIDEAMLALVNEIERLREVIKTHNTREESALAEILMNELLVRQNAQIKELEAENKRVLLELQKSKNRNMCEERVKKDMQQAARIKELEDALVEERAKQFDVDEPCPARTHHEYCDILKGLCDGFPHMWKQCPRKPEKLDAARQQLQAEGKIGPDADAKPQVWQITEERKAAIKELSELLTAIGCPSCHYYIQKNYGEDITVLRAMLTEADHDKP